MTVTVYLFVICRQKHELPFARLVHTHVYIRTVQRVSGSSFTGHRSYTLRTEYAQRNESLCVTKCIRGDRERQYLTRILYLRSIRFVEAHRRRAEECVVVCENSKRFRMFARTIHKTRLGVFMRSTPTEKKKKKNPPNEFGSVRANRYWSRAYNNIRWSSIRRQRSLFHATASGKLRGKSDCRTYRC